MRSSTTTDMGSAENSSRDKSIKSVRSQGAIGSQAAAGDPESKTSRPFETESRRQQSSDTSTIGHDRPSVAQEGSGAAPPDRPPMASAEHAGDIADVAAPAHSAPTPWTSASTGFLPQQPAETAVLPVAAPAAGTSSLPSLPRVSGVLPVSPAVAAGQHPATVYLPELVPRQPVVAIAAGDADRLQQFQWQAQRQAAVERQLWLEQQRADQAVAEAEELRAQLLSRLRLLRGRAVAAGAEDAGGGRRRHTMPPLAVAAAATRSQSVEVHGESAGEAPGGSAEAAVAWLRQEVAGLRARVEGGAQTAPAPVAGGSTGALAAAGLASDAEALASLGRRLRAAEEEAECERRRRRRAEDELEEARRTMRRVQDEALLPPAQGRGGGRDAEGTMLREAEERAGRLEAELRVVQRRLSDRGAAGSGEELDAARAEVAELGRRLAEATHRAEAAEAEAKALRSASSSSGGAGDAHDAGGGAAMAVADELRVRAETAERQVATLQATVSRKRWCCIMPALATQGWRWGRG